MLTKKWWYAALIRAARTVAQTAVASISTTALISEVNWLAVLSASVLAGILSMLTSLAGLPEVELEESRELQSIADPEIRIVYVDEPPDEDGHIVVLNNEE